MVQAWTARMMARSAGLIVSLFAFAAIVAASHQHQHVGTCLACSRPEEVRRKDKDSNLDKVRAQVADLKPPTDFAAESAFADNSAPLPAIIEQLAIATFDEAAPVLGPPNSHALEPPWSEHFGRAPPRDPR